MYQTFYMMLNHNKQVILSLSFILLFAALMMPRKIASQEPQDSADSKDLNVKKKEKVSADQITKWIEQLGDSTFKIRDQAHKKLIKIGNPAIPELQKYVVHKNQEIQYRVASILIYFAVRGDECTATTIKDILRPVITPQDLADIDCQKANFADTQIRRWIKERRIKVYYTDNKQIRFFSFHEKLSTIDSQLKYINHLNSLKSLDLSNTKVTDAGLIHLKNLSSLKSINLTHTKISGTGLAHLKKLKSLEELSLSKTKISDINMVHLKGFKSLTAVSLNNTNITDASLIYLKELKSLQFLNLSGTMITEKGVASLKGELMKCIILK